MALFSSVSFSHWFTQNGPLITILAMFLLSAVGATLVAQAISYQGAAHEFSMLVVLMEYLGMLSVWGTDILVRGSNRRTSSISESSDTSDHRRSSNISEMSVNSETGLITDDNSRAINSGNTENIRVEVLNALSNERSNSYNVRSLISLDFLATPLSRKFYVGIAYLVFIDLLAAAFAFFGLVYAGSGLFSVINSSHLVITAVLAWIITKTPISKSKWLVIILVTFGLCFSGFGMFFADAEVHQDSFIVSSSGVTVVAENSLFEGNTRIFFGIFFTLLSTVFYSLEYVLAEKFLHEFKVPGISLVGYIGLSGFITVFIYILFYTIPKWQYLVYDEIAIHHGRTGTIIFLYIFFILLEAAYNYLYFRILETSGALTAGVMQGLRAVFVFGVSSVTFCNTAVSQCFDVFKGLSATIVIGGVMLYAYYSFKEENSGFQPIPRSLEDNEELTELASISPQT